MTEKLADDVRAVFDAGYVPSPRLADRVLRRLAEEPAPQRRASWIASAAGVALVVAVVLPALWFGVVSRGQHAGQAGQPDGSGPGPGVTMTALSLGVPNASGDWMVRRLLHIDGSRPSDNVLYQTSDGGRSFSARLQFTGVYEGMSWDRSGRAGVLWTIDREATGCKAGPGGTEACKEPSWALTVYATADGGLHWVPRAPTRWPAGEVYFRGLQGWVASQSPGTGRASAPIYRTTDGGLTWIQVGTLPGIGTWGSTSGVGEASFEFASQQVGWFATGSLAIAGNSGLYGTTDGGRSWAPVMVAPPAGLAGSAMQVGYPVLLKDGHALLPVAFGQGQASPTSTDPNSFSASAHYLYSSGDGLIWSDPRRVFANGVQPTGAEWQNAYLDSSRWWFTAVNQRSAGEPVPQAAPAVLRTSDGGRTWQVFKSPTILQMIFTDARRGWAFAVAGPQNTNLLLRTTDGGATWAQVALP